MKNLLYLCLVIGLFSFKSDKNKGRLLSKHLRATYSYVPSGELVLSSGQESIRGFYMMNTEVTNIAFKEFISYLQTHDQEDIAKEIKSNMKTIKDELWQEKYFHHPAYDNFPVSNMSKGTAQLYCSFLEDALNRSGGIKKGYKIKNCRLPSKKEWTYAASGGHNLAPYPWGGYYYKNAKGCLLANFNAMGGEVISTDKTTGKYEVNQEAVSKYGRKLGPVPVDSYFPNDYGLYNMAGNMAELTHDDSVMGGSFQSTGHDIKVTSTLPFEGRDITIGFRPIFEIVKESD